VLPIFTALLAVAALACAAYGLAFFLALVWMRRCPVCRAVMRQQFGDRGPWLCPSCGWA
jgi:hypothetical protein